MGIAAGAAGTAVFLPQLLVNARLFGSLLRTGYQVAGVSSGRQLFDPGYVADGIHRVAAHAGLLLPLGMVAVAGIVAAPIEPDQSARRLPCGRAAEYHRVSSGSAHAAPAAPYVPSSHSGKPSCLPPPALRLARRSVAPARAPPGRCTVPGSCGRPAASRLPFWWHCRSGTSWLPSCPYRSGAARPPRPRPRLRRPLHRLPRSAPRPPPRHRKPLPTFRRYSSAALPGGRRAPTRPARGTSPPARSRRSRFAPLTGSSSRLTS
jgi:hypothetical protein